MGVLKSPFLTTRWPKKNFVPGIVFFLVNNPREVKEFVSTTVVLSLVSPVRSLPISKFRTWRTIGETRSFHEGLSLPNKLIPMMKSFGSHGGQKIILFFCLQTPSKNYILRNFKTQKWVSMFLTYLVENFILVIFRLRIFFFM